MNLGEFQPVDQKKQNITYNPYYVFFGFVKISA